MYNPRVAGLTRIRNESLIIRETLDHFSLYCDAGIYVYDDCSEDDTVKICKAHRNVKGVISSEERDEDRVRAEWQNRKAIIDFARKKDKNIDWFVYFDADERMYFDMDVKKLENNDAVVMPLFDSYITEEDKDKKYNGNLVMLRKYFGPEYRMVIMMFRNLPQINWTEIDERPPSFPVGTRILKDGYVKHYGKAISVEQWEETCRYYTEEYDIWKDKWEARKGKAVHIISDFGRELKKFEDIGNYAVQI